MTSSLLKENARRIIFINSPKIFFACLLYLLMAEVLSWLTSRLPGTIDPQNIYERLTAGEILSLSMIYGNLRPMGIMLALVLSLLIPVINIGFLSYCLKAKRKEDAEYRDLLNGFNYFAKVIAIFLITTFFILLWSLLLIIPGIIAAYRYRLAYFILADDPSKGALQCVDESVIMMRGGKMDLFILDLSFFGWILLDWLIIILSPLPYTPPVVMIWLAPYRMITYTNFYVFRKSVIAV